jgi:hypothetical protein
MQQSWAVSDDARQQVYVKRKRYCSLDACDHGTRHPVTTLVTAIVQELEAPSECLNECR